MRFKVTRKGVFDTKGKPVEVGTVMNVKGSDVPAYLVGKGEPMGAERKAAVTNPKDGGQAGQGAA